MAEGWEVRMKGGPGHGGVAVRKEVEKGSYDLHEPPGQD